MIEGIDLSQNSKRIFGYIPNLIIIGTKLGGSGVQVHLLFFWSRSLVLLNKSRILLYKSRILILHVFCTPTFQASLAPMNI